jgi:hypothetical protein
MSDSLNSTIRPLQPDAKGKRKRETITAATPSKRQGR